MTKQQAMAAYKALEMVNNGIDELGKLIREADRISDIDEDILIVFNRLFEIAPTANLALLIALSIADK